MTQDIEQSADKYVQHISRKIMGCNVLAMQFRLFTILFSIKCSAQSKNINALLNKHFTQLH